MNAAPVSPAEDRPSAARLDARTWRVVGVAVLGPLMTQMDSTIVNVSLATIRQDLHASLDAVQWVIGGYLLALALTLPLNGWLVDRLGAKRLYLVCFSAFTLASLLCGMERTITGLIWARVLQGMAGGLLAPMTQMMLARVAGKRLARVMGLTAMPVLLAPLLGPVVAGEILKHAGWPWLFYVNLPIGIVAVTLAVFLLPADDALRRRRPFDMTGFLLISPGIALLLYGLDNLDGAAPRAGRLALLAGALLLGAFVRHALHKQAAALIDLRLFTNRVFSAATATQFLSNGASYAGQMLVPLFLIGSRGIPPARAGWILAPMGLGMMLIYPSLGFLTDRFGCRAVSAGGVMLAILGTIPFLWMTQNPLSPAILALALFARGAGQDAIGVPTISAAYISVPREQLALATTASNIVQRLGGPVGTTTMAIVLSLAAAHLPASGPRVFLLGFAALIGLQLVLLTAARRLPIRMYGNTPSTPDNVPS